VNTGARRGTSPGRLCSPRLVCSESEELEAKEEEEAWEAEDEEFYSGRGHKGGAEDAAKVALRTAHVSAGLETPPFQLKSVPAFMKRRAGAADDGMTLRARRLFPVEDGGTVISGTIGGHWR
jgi:hypothetical protein